MTSGLFRPAGSQLSTQLSTFGTELAGHLGWLPAYLPSSPSLPQSRLPRKARDEGGASGSSPGDRSAPGAEDARSWTDSCCPKCRIAGGCYYWCTPGYPAQGCSPSGWHLPAPPDRHPAAALHLPRRPPACTLPCVHPPCTPPWYTTRARYCPVLHYPALIPARTTLSCTTLYYPGYPALDYPALCTYPALGYPACVPTLYWASLASLASWASSGFLDYPALVLPCPTGSSAGFPEEEVPTHETDARSRAS